MLQKGDWIVSSESSHFIGELYTKEEEAHTHEIGSFN
jgi:hypothetical protein